MIKDHIRTRIMFPSSQVSYSDIDVHIDQSVNTSLSEFEAGINEFYFFLKEYKNDLEDLKATLKTATEA